MLRKQEATVAARPRGRCFVIMAVALLIALRAGFSQAPASINLPTHATTIYGDRLTAPRQVYSVQLALGSTLDVSLSRGPGTTGLYDLSLYALHDGLTNFSPATCVTRAFADAAPAPQKTSGNPKPKVESQANIKYVAASAGSYYVVVQFYGVGMQLQLAANVTAPLK